MKATTNATHLADAVNSYVEQLREIAKNGNLHFVDVTFNRDCPIDAGEYRALIGFKDQRDAKLWAELTGGEFALFYKEDGVAKVAHQVHNLKVGVRVPSQQQNLNKNTNI